MICRKCKQDVPDGPFCSQCGAKQERPERRPKARGNGTGSVYKLPNGTWRAVATLGYIPGPDGKPMRRTRTKSGFKTKREAQEYIPQLRIQLSALSANITFRQIYEKWEAEHEKDVKANTMNCYKAAYKYYEPIWFAKMADLKTAALQACLDACPKGRRTQENMKALGTMLFRYAMRDDVVSKNYAELLRVGGETQAGREPFTDEELEKMKKAVGTVPRIELVLILCYTGFRLEELLQLQDTDLHYDEINQSYYFIGGEKTEAGMHRIVAISPKIIDYVLQWEKPGFIFSEDGKKVQQKKFRQKWYYPALEQAGVRRLVPHSCRHTFATLMKKIDAPDADKMAMIGHTSMEMTTHYTHTDLKSAVNIATQL